MEDFYKVLNIPRGATDEQIKQAVNHEMRTWTQRTNAPTIEKRQEAERMVKLITEAEKILLNSAMRAEHDRQLDRMSYEQAAGGQRWGVNPNQSYSEEVEALIQKAILLMRVDNYPPAISLLKKAAALDPGNVKVEKMLKEAKKAWGQLILKH